MATVNAWYALQVQPNHDRLAAATLRAKGYSVLFPTYTTRAFGDIGRVQERPLFPGYLFCELSPQAGGRIVTTPGVTRVVSFGGRWVPVENSEIDALRQISASPVVRQPWRYIPAGYQVRIESGPLKGVAGILLSNGKRLVVTVTLLQRSISVLLDDTTVVSPLDGALSAELSQDSRYAVTLTGQP